jgi:hypothetical protein
MEEKRIQYFDSMRGVGTVHLERIMRYLQDKHQEIHDRPLPTNQWTLHPIAKEDQPTQPNGCDCGLFVMLTTLFLCNDYPLVFSQKELQSNGAIKEVLPKLSKGNTTVSTQAYQSYLDECRFHLIRSLLLGRLVMNYDEDEHDKLQFQRNIRTKRQPKGRLPKGRLERKQNKGGTIPNPKAGTQRTRNFRTEQ